ncbi:MAG: PaaI family thioesterase [Lachnospiraceae bacterium]|nr:PaaI family thioesterase [Lachnospiraceae bacterium]
MKMTKIEKAREFFMNDRFAMVTSGIEIDEVGERYAKCSMKLTDGHRNAVGQVMGGAIYTLADFVFAVATNFEQPVTVTTVSQISYLGVAKGSILYGESRMLKDGRRNCFYQIDITDDLGNHVAVVSTSGVHLNV